MYSTMKWLLLMIVMPAGIIKAQNFNFSLAKDSSSYSELVSPAVLSSEESLLNKSFGIHLPFSFNFCGSASDSLIIETNGFIVFNKQAHLSLISFNSFSGNKDTAQNYPASIDYVISGAEANRIVKIEFKKLSQNTYSFYDHLSYQVWLYENGNIIEFHIGSNSYAGTGNEIQSVIGAINQQMDTADKAFLIGGDPGSPSGQVINGDNDLTFLTSMPRPGTIYRLTPSN